MYKIQWHKNDGVHPIPKYSTILAYCPLWSEHGYEVVTYDGSGFSCSSHGEEIDTYVLQWANIQFVVDEA